MLLLSLARIVARIVNPNAWKEKTKISDFCKQSRQNSIDINSNKTRKCPKQFPKQYTKNDEKLIKKTALLNSFVVIN